MSFLSVFILHARFASEFKTCVFKGGIASGKGDKDAVTVGKNALLFGIDLRPKPWSFKTGIKSYKGSIGCFLSNYFNIDSMS